MSGIDLDRLMTRHTPPGTGVFAPRQSRMAAPGRATGQRREVPGNDRRRRKRCPGTSAADVGVGDGVNGLLKPQAGRRDGARRRQLCLDHACGARRAKRLRQHQEIEIVFILPTNGGEVLTILAAIALGRMLPVTAAQILWVNMITAATLALALAFEPAESDIMRQPPRNPQNRCSAGS